MDRMDFEGFREGVHNAVHDFIRSEKHHDVLARTLWAFAEENPAMARYLLYEFVMDYRFHPHISTVIDQLIRKDILWNHPNLSFIRQQFQEQDDFIETPPVIDEGVIECIRCKSKRTFSFSKQTRRGDESTTVFVRCSECSKTFRI